MNAPQDPTGFGDDDRYGSDVLAGFSKRAPRAAAPEMALEPDLVLETVADGWVGAVVAWDATGVHLEDRFGRVRVFPRTTAFLVDGRPVRVVVPAVAPKGPARTASGSLAVAQDRARVARGGRILVEGRHDAELVERVWGDDLRVEGVVVEYLEGVDRLGAFLDELRPGPGRRVGVLVDHLVPGSKESRIADAVAAGRHGAHALVVGHPFVDVWQSVTPAALGIPAWPSVPRSIEWKHGICEAFGWPHATQADIAQAWQRILGRVRSYADLEPALLGRVEELIDFVTAE
ncbi:MAG: DUF3097 domain-containing protein [Microbacteriaceae bacterium]|nr:DUF3097 domain-containing protein [Microbacteriaceae bacterium]